MKRLWRIAAGAVGGSTLGLVALVAWDELQWRLIERRARRRLRRNA